MSRDEYAEGVGWRKPPLVRGRSIRGGLVVIVSRSPGRRDVRLENRGGGMGGEKDDASMGDRGGRGGGIRSWSWDLL